MSEPFDDATLEQVNAYLDGELGPKDRAAFEERLAREPALRAMTDRMRTLGAQMNSALGKQPSAPPSDALMAAVRSFAAAQTAEAPAAAPNVVDFSSRKWPSPEWREIWRMPLAAGIAVCIGAGGMWMVQHRQGKSLQSAAVSLTDGVVTETSTLHAALEETPSGDVLSGTSGNVRPILSFASKDGRFCREFESFGEESSVVGVACKGERGWKMEVMLSAAPHSPNETQYAPASGFNAKALDDVVSQLMEGQSLSSDAENAAKANGWRRRN